MNVHKLSQASEAYKIPSLEGHDGYAVGAVGDITLSKDFDGADVCGPNALVFNAAKTIVVVNCSHPLFQDKSIVKKVQKSMFNSLSLKDGFAKSEDDSIEQYFSGDFTPVPAPEPEPVVEPEPSDFEVETWVPQDELPYSGE